MVDDFSDRIASAVAARTTRLDEDARRADERSVEARATVQRTTELWMRLRDEIVMPTLVQTQRAIGGASHEVAVLNSDGGGVKIEVRPEGEQYTASLSVEPQLSAGKIIVSASFGEAGTHSVDADQFSAEWFQDLVARFIEDVFGDTERPSRNW